MNVALNRPAYQVSDFGNYPASNANDGSPSTVALSNFTPANPWWAVDLGVALYVYGVKFINVVAYGESIPCCMLNFNRRLLHINFKLNLKFQEAFLTYEYLNASSY